MSSTARAVMPVIALTFVMAGAGEGTIATAGAAPPAVAATGAPPPALAADAQGSDSTQIATINVTSAPRALCSASVRVGRKSARLGSLRTAAGGGGRWLFHVAPGAPSGRWEVLVACRTAAGRSTGRAAMAITKGPGSSSGRLMQPGTLRAFGAATEAQKGVGLGSAGGNRYPTGQCTWYVWSRRPDLPWFSGPSGDAKNWTASARAAGIPTGSQPIAGAAVVFQPGQYGAGSYGHVAYVEAVSGGTITIAEANYAGRPAGSKRTTAWSGLQFIYGGPAKSGPGQPLPPARPPTSTALPTPGAFPHTVRHTCANGACGLKIHAAPSLSSPTVGIRNDGAEVDIVCQTVGDAVSGADGSFSPVWDELSDGVYAADFYIDTPGSNGAFSPPIPRCPGAPPTIPPPTAAPLTPAPPTTPAPPPAPPATPTGPAHGPTVAPPPVPVSVDLTSSAPQPVTIGGTATLSAKYPGAGGVEFDAYYAADPSNINTVAWRPLGRGKDMGDGVWALQYDTHAIPNQGNAGWGTVNLVAIVLDASGGLTPTRYYHRVDIGN